MTKGYSFVSPNLTPDPETGIIADWDEEIFLDRFHSGRIYEGSPMPWGFFGRMDNIDIKAIYRFLRTVKPVKNQLNQYVYAPGEEYQPR
jgi:hypothetical protein